MSWALFRKTRVFRFIAFTVLTAFGGMLPASPSLAQVAIVMPPPGQMIHITRHFEPPQMVGLKVDLKDPFSFDFIMDQGETPMSDDVKKAEFNKIIKYFLVSLTMPNKDMWVNLSPYESQRIIPQIFAQTEMGRDLLAQDYILKQFTASLMYPEDGLGRKFWDKVYAQAQARFGTTDISVNTFNKVWIVADHADVYQKDDTAFLIGSHLKVMLEQDYMAVEKHKEMFGSVKAVNTEEAMDAKTKMASDLVRQIIIPAIEKEVNEGKSFAAVRQVYNAEIMATWFKKTLRESLVGQVFANKSKIAGQKLNDPKAMEKIYKQYLRAYKKGVFNYIREDATPDGQTIPRKYFSGGLQAMSTQALAVITPAMATKHSKIAQRVDGWAKIARKLLSHGRLAVAYASFKVDRAGSSMLAKFMETPEFDLGIDTTNAAKKKVPKTLQAPSEKKSDLIYSKAIAAMREGTTIKNASPAGIERALREIAQARVIQGNSFSLFDYFAEVSNAFLAQRGLNQLRKRPLSERIKWQNPANQSQSSRSTQTRNNSAQRNGGINLNDENLDLNIKVDGKGMPLPAQYQDKAMMNLNGLTSFIRRISPVTPQNVPVLYEVMK